MKQCMLVVLTNPVSGREQEYNEWYTNVHLSDVLKMPGFKSAQRFTLAREGGSEWKYMALYEFESEEPEKVMELLQKHVGDMTMSDALDTIHVSAVPWVAICEKKTRAVS